jgi:uncharacterized protein (TIGR03437 family)
MRLRILWGAVALVACALPPLKASTTLVPSVDGMTVYDTANNISWLADFNLAASNRFGLPICTTTSSTVPCVNASGFMNWVGAVAWVAAMNAANYMGHSDWQLPTTPLVDKGCNEVGPQNNSFGFNCSLGALGSLYYNALGLKAPNTAVPIPTNQVGPFSNLQPYFYWSQSGDGGVGFSVFSFGSGSQGGNSSDNFLYTFPMIAGKIPGTPSASGMGLQVNPGGQTVYDPMAGVTWPANANLAATNTFGLPVCTSPTTPALCVGQDGAMDKASADQFIANMNRYNGTGYLGQTNWGLPPSNASCPTFNCDDLGNPMGILFYEQFGLSAGVPAVATPNISVGPFHNLQPYLYWSCPAIAIQDPCDTAGLNMGIAEWAFSFGNGFLGTDLLEKEYYITAYFVGSRTSTSGPVIAEVANAEGESPTIASNTWVEIKGSNLAPAGISSPDCAPGYCWQTSDFLNNQLPTKLKGISVSVNGNSAYVYYISPTQINVLTPPDAMSGPVQVVVTGNGVPSASFTAQAQSLSPSFFVFNGGPYVAATHLNGSLCIAPISGACLVGPATLYPGSSAPAKPNEMIALYANGFGTTSTPVVSGSVTQSGTLSPLPVIKIGGIPATVQFAGLSAVGEFQFNVVIPATLGNGDQPITATYGGASTQSGALIAIHN